MNPYQCGFCGGDLGHDEDCDFHPDNLTDYRRPTNPLLNLFMAWLGFTGATVVRKVYETVHRVSHR